MTTPSGTRRLASLRGRVGWVSIHEASVDPPPMSNTSARGVDPSSREAQPARPIAASSCPEINRSLRPVSFSTRLTKSGKFEAWRQASVATASTGCALAADFARAYVQRSNSPLHGLLGRVRRAVPQTFAQPTMRKKRQRR